MPTSAIISIVDDDDYVRLSLGSLLRSYGYNIQLFDSAEHFLCSELMGVTDCLISDIQMPGMSGLNMCEHLIAQGVQIPVIFMTASAEPAPRLAAQRLGAAGYLTKPFDEQPLVACIQAALNSGRSEA